MAGATGACCGVSGPPRSISGVIVASSDGVVALAAVDDESETGAETVARSAAEGVSAKVGNEVRNKAAKTMRVRWQEFIEIEDPLQMGGVLQL